MTKTRRKFTKEQKDQAIDDYLSGARSAQQIAADLETDVQAIYRWKTVREEKEKGARFDELIEEGNSYGQAKKIVELEAEIEEYKKKLAEQVIINDLLKKLQTSKNSQPESELTGLIKTTKKLNQKRKPVK